MLVRDDLDVGVASHTGPVRSANEDDYLLYEPRGDQDLARVGRLFVIADGMGGTAGGAEASRVAVRTFADRALAAGDSEPAERISAGFTAAARAVFEASRANRQLAEMGTTMTALLVRGGVATVGHVGDSRCVVARDGQLDRLTEDHAVAEPRHLLTRCLGAGREEEDVDITDTQCAPGDVFALMTDGVWGVLSDDDVVRILRSGDAPAAARSLVAAAFEAGSTDNATAIVVRVLVPSGAGAARSIELSADESGLSLDAATAPEPGELWPWVLLLFGVALAVLAALRLAGIV